MELFKQFTDVSQGVRRSGAAAIDMCHVACGALLACPGSMYMSYVHGDHTRHAHMLTSAQQLQAAPTFTPLPLCKLRRHVEAQTGWTALLTASLSRGSQSFVLPAGIADAYWELRIKPWDVAAGTLLVTEAGAPAPSACGGQQQLE